MGTRKHQAPRCAECKMLVQLCLCGDAREIASKLPPVKTQVTLLVHHRELATTTNSGLHLRFFLPGFRFFVRGLPDQKLKAEDILKSGCENILLFPTQTARDLRDPGVEFWKRLNNKPINLIVPEGSWRQASKVPKREAFLQEIPAVFLPPDSVTPSTYQLRKETKPGGLGTFEAVVRALDYLEDPSPRKLLESYFSLFVERTLKSRRGVL